MYGQGNYAPQFRHGPPTPLPPFQLGPLPPPPPPSQQGTPAPLTHAVQSGPPPVYQHGPPAPQPLVQQGGPPPPMVQQGPPQSIQVPSPGMVNTYQPYLHQQPSVHGGSYTPPSYPTFQHNSRHPSPITTQNMHHLPPPVPPPPGPPLAGPSHPEMIGPPLPPRVLPPPPSQMLYRTTLHPPPSGIGHLQHGQSLPPPPPSSFLPVMPGHFESLVHAPVEHAHPPSMPPPPPPPPPSSPPPLPPSPPPPASPPHLSAKSSETSSIITLDVASGISHHSESDFGSGEISNSSERVILSVDKVVGPAQITDDVPINDYPSVEGGPTCEMDSLVEYGLSSKTQALFALPSPPPKPVEEEIVRKIEVLCQFIAKNGPDFEDMARENEYGNPKFAFLFGGEQGSEAAIAHEYFQWTKRKCHMESKSHNVSEKSDSLVRSLDIESSMRPNNLIDEGPSHSPADSDMDMEELDESTFGRPFVKDHNPVTRSSAAAAECTLDSCIQKSTPSREVPGLLIKGGSPFRLIQDYASDDSAEDDDMPSFGDVSPARVSPSVAVGTNDWHEDVGTNLVGPTSMQSRMPDVSPESHKVVEADVRVSDPLDAVVKTDELGINILGDQTSTERTDSLEVFQHKDALQGDDVDIDTQNGKFQKKDAKQASTVVKVDEFGRLVREGASDSDSDGAHYTGRRGRRGRSRNQSRSPQDRWRRRSRSPWRRKEKRSRSRSWSPKKQRSRSKSPSTFRRTGEFGGEKIKRDRGQIPACFDFLRGRCYRGASCRFLHRDSAVGDAPRSHRGRQQQYQEVPQDLSNPVVREESHFSVDTHEVNNIPVKMSIDAHDAFLKEEVKIQEIPCRDLSVSSTDAQSDGGLDEKTESGSVRDDSKPVISIEVGQSPITVIGEVDQSDSQEKIAEGPEARQLQQVQEEPAVHLQETEISKQPAENLDSLMVDSSPIQLTTDTETKHLPSEIPSGEPSTGGNSEIQSSQANVSVPLAQPMSQPLPTQTSATSTDQLTLGEPYPDKIPSTQPYPDPTSTSQPGMNQIATSHPFPPESFAAQPLPPKEFHMPSFSAGDFQFQHCQLPPAPPFLQGVNAPHGSLPPKEYNLPPVATNFHSQSAPMERLPLYQAPLHNQHSQSPAPAKPSWTSLPPPPSYVNESTPSSAIHIYGSRPLQFQQNPMPPRTEFPQPLMRPYPHEVPTHSQAVDFHPQTSPLMEEHHRPPFPVESFRPTPLPTDKVWSQPFGGSSFVREEIFTHTAMPEGNQFHPGLQPDYHLHPRPQLQEHQPLPNQRFTSQFPAQGFMASSSFAQDNIHSQPVPFRRESPAKQLQPFPDDNLPHRSFSREDFGTPIGNLSYMQQQQSSYGLQGSAAYSSHLSAPGNVDPSMSRYPSTYLDSKQPFHLPDVGGSKISNSTHYNPFASTFEHPLGSSKFNSSFRREIDTNYSSKYDSSFGLSHASVGGQGTGGLGSRQTTSPPDSSRSGGQILPALDGSVVNASLGEVNNPLHPREPSAEGFPRTQSQFVRGSTAGDQYDPLFDSIEPSSNAFKKLDHFQERDATSHVINRSVAARVANDSDIMLRLSSSRRPLDAEENNKQEEGAAAAVIVSPEIDDFGETALDAEVGAVENGSPQPGEGINWSPGNPIELGNTATGEIEIDQVQTAGKTKKSKDSRSTKLFKIAIADFVKEVLKPSWRQGNMSKEAFKTIVKKTVDKVSGAMKNHQVPKSQAKINQYVESSQRKLTKLVMGYVDKYVKV